VLVAVVVLFVVGVCAMESAEEWIRVPGGHTLHRSCIHEVRSGETVDVENLPRCMFRRPITEDVQVYAIDTHWTTTDVIMTEFNASFTTPGNPPRAAGQINYFWPGFKSTEPTMGLPVIQPVLQYGNANEWIVRSWYVFGNQGEAVVSDPIPIKPGDVTASYMKFDKNSGIWTIFANNTRTSKTTILKIAKSHMHNVDYKVAMLVLETIMPLNDCKQLPANPSTITFSAITVNGQSTVPWVSRTARSDCNEKVLPIVKDTVVFSWTN